MSDEPAGDAPGYEPTSERLSVDDYQASPVDFLIYCCHLATYDFVAPMVTGKRVLDFGCGTGYGTDRLAPHCESITGVDISGNAIAFARSRHQAPNLTYQAIEPLPAHPAPFPDGSFDVVVSFQVVEHIWDAEAYAAELARLLVPGGTAIVATPDRTTRLFRRQRPWNLFHVIEYDAIGLAAVLSPRFDSVSMHYMTADPEVERIELRRARQLRWATLPVTFPRAPEGLRTAGLRALKRLQARGEPAPAPTDPVDHGFGIEAVHISTTPRPALNLIAVAEKAAPEPT